MEDGAFSCSVIWCPTGGSGGIIEGFICAGHRGGSGEPSVWVLGRGFYPLKSWTGWAELFSLLHRRTRGGLGLTLGVWDQGEEVMKCAVVFAGGTTRSTFGKNARRKERFPFLFGNDGKMLGVSWVGFFFSFSSFVLHSSPFCDLFSLKKKRCKRERGNFTLFAKCQNE